MKGARLFSAHLLSLGLLLGCHPQVSDCHPALKRAVARRPTRLYVASSSPRPGEDLAWRHAVTLPHPPGLEIAAQPPYPKEDAAPAAAPEPEAAPAQDKTYYQIVVEQKMLECMSCQGDCDPICAGPPPVPRGAPPPPQPLPNLPIPLPR